MNTLKPAIEKQIKRRRYFMGSHQDLLDCNWRFVSLVALPFIENKSQVFTNKVCKQCLNFILDKNDVLNLSDWATNILNFDTASRIEHVTEADRSYTNLYNRLVGFMSLSTKFGTSSNVFMDQAETRKFLEERVLGEQRKGLTCEELSEKEILENISFSDKVLKDKPLSSLQVLYFWNEMQLKFLLKDIKLVLFLSDFGVGKTLIKKHKALSFASQNQDVEVIYLSLAQVHKFTSSLEKFREYKIESIFDIANRMEFKNTGVNFVSLQDILEETDWENGRINVCNVVERFIRCHDNAHLFIDEFPLTYEISDADVSFLNCIKERSTTNRYLWLTLRLCDVRNAHFEELNGNKEYYEKSLRNSGFDEETVCLLIYGCH